MNTVDEFIAIRESRGRRWPKKPDIYNLQFSNPKNFRRCTRKLGRKLFIISEEFDAWLLEATQGDQS